MVRLEGVLSSNDLVLVDGSIKTNSRFKIEEHTALSSINFNSLNNAYKRLKRFLGILEHPTTRTIPEVTQELEQYYKMTSRRVDELVEIYNWVSPTKGFFEKLESLRGLRIDAAKVVRASNNVECIIKDPNYNVLTDMIKIISRTLKLKKPKGSAFDAEGNKLGFDKAYLSDTDERLTAALYYESVFENICPVLLTNDRDFENLATTYEILGSTSFSPYNGFFKQKLAQNKFKIYSLRGGYLKRFDLPKKINYQKGRRFTLPGMSRKESMPAYQEVYMLWEKFMENMQNPEKE